MTTLYLIRHGQSLSNDAHICAGHSDFPLSKLGLIQAEAAAGVLAEKPITAIYSSDLKRAYQTALATAKRLGLPITVNQNLRELCAGTWEGKPYSYIREHMQDVREAWHNDPEHNPLPGGESIASVRKRMMGTVGNIAKRHDGQHVLIASHATAIRIFASGVRGTEFSHSDPDLRNTAITTVTYENGVFTMKEFGNADHLTDMLSGQLNNGILQAE